MIQSALKRNLLIFILAAAAIAAAALSSCNAGSGSETSGYQNGQVRGTVLLGPNCPVVRNPPDERCADKPYAVRLQAADAGSGQVVKQFQSDEQGRFAILLPPGRYIINSPPAAKPFPRCASAGTFTVQEGATVTVSVSCDTGIR